MAESLGMSLLRMQCYEGLDESRALYEWKYGKQLLYTQILKEKINDLISDADGLDASLRKLAGFQDLFFSRDFLEPRPLLKAMEQTGWSVLLIDEIDKSDEAFEALLLEVLSDYQVTVPEIGTISAQTPPLVILTSNNTRELGDALKRRCLHLHIGFPDAEREERIVQARVPEVSPMLLKQMVGFVQALRDQDIRKVPSISETVDWARTLLLLHADSLDPQLVRDTLNVILKRQSDITAIDNKLDELSRNAITDASGKA
jgi:MoxR-like ATPase